MENKFPIEEIKAQKEFLLNNPERQFVPKTAENIKTAKQWVEEYLNSKEGKKETAKINQEFKDYILYGKPTSYLNEQLLNEIKNYEK